VSEAAWPLSAAATEVLLTPGIDDDDLLRVTLKELVLRRVWRLERSGRRLHLVPGTVPAPPLAPLPDADAAVRQAVDRVGPDVRKVVPRLRRTDADILVRDAADEELRERGLVEIERRKALRVFSRKVVTSTADGERWAADARERLAAAERAVAGHTPGAPAQLVALGALVPFLAPPVLAELDEVVRRPTDAVVGGPGTGGVEESDWDLGALDGLDLDDLDAFDSLDTSFDGWFDLGSSDGGGGGDGGGGN
jgi:hypothetical protein